MRILYILCYLFFFLFCCHWLYDAKLRCCNASNVSSTGKINSLKDSENSPPSEILTQGDSQNVELQNSSDSSALKNSEQVILHFNFSNSKPIPSEDWDSYKDSLIHATNNGNNLKITGQYFASEEYSGSHPNLGLERAHNVKELFENLIDNDQLILTSDLVPERTDSITQAFPSNIFTLVKPEKKVIETLDDASLYFDYNSTKPITDEEIINYIDKVVQRIEKSGETISLIGHTDNTGDEKSNEQLGLWRAMKVKKLLVKNGIAENRIQVSSEGQSNPVASNGTRAGRQQNRRVELRIK